MKITKKMLALMLVISIINISIPPKVSEAGWFSDFCGAVFTFITAPLQLVAPDNPTLRKNNPFRKKAWEVEPEPFVYKPLVPHKKPEPFIVTITTEVIKEVIKEVKVPEVHWSTVTVTKELIKEVKVPEVHWSTVTVTKEVIKEVKVPEVHWSTVTVNSASLVPEELNIVISSCNATIRGLKSRLFNSEEDLKILNEKTSNLKTATNNNYKKEVEEEIKKRIISIEILLIKILRGEFLSQKFKIAEDKGAAKSLEKKIEIYTKKLASMKMGISAFSDLIEDISKKIDEGKGEYHITRLCPINDILNEKTLEDLKASFGNEYLIIQRMNEKYLDKKKTFFENRTNNNYLNKIIKKIEFLQGKLDLQALEIDMWNMEQVISGVSYELLLPDREEEESKIKNKLKILLGKKETVQKLINEGKWDEIRPLSVA